MNSENKLKIAVVGCGRISSYHFDSIKAHQEHLSLCAVCDTNKELLDLTCETHGVRGYLDLDELLSTEKPDLLSICTPSGLHAKLTLLAAKHKVNVICEKPIATNWDDGLNMVKQCENEGVRLFIIKQNRKNPTLQLLKEAIDSDRFGQIYHVSSNVYWSRTQDYYDQASWRGTHEMDGGAFMNQASHYIDVLQWLIGPVKEVQAMTATLARNIEAEDTGVVNLAWKRGTLGSINVCVLTYPNDLEGSITVLGEKGTVKIGGVALNKIENWSFERAHAQDEQVKNCSYDTASVYGFGHPLCYKNIIEVMRGEAEPETDGKEGLKTLELLSAIYQAAKTNKTVQFPLT